MMTNDLTDMTYLGQCFLHECFLPWHTSYMIARSHLDEQDFKATSSHTSHAIIPEGFGWLNEFLIVRVFYFGLTVLGLAIFNNNYYLFSVSNFCVFDCFRKQAFKQDATCSTAFVNEKF